MSTDLAALWINILLGGIIAFLLGRIIYELIIRQR